MQIVKSSNDNKMVIENEARIINESGRLKESWNQLEAEYVTMLFLSKKILGVRFYMNLIVLYL